MKSNIYYTEQNVRHDYSTGKGVTTSTVKGYFAESDGFISHFGTEVTYHNYPQKIKAIKAVAARYAQTDVTFNGDILPSPF